MVALPCTPPPLAGGAQLILNTLVPELPPVEQHEYGIRLPPPEQQLTALNYQIGRKRAAQEEPAQARQKKAR